MINFWTKYDFYGTFLPPRKNIIISNSLRIESLRNIFHFISGISPILRNFQFKIPDIKGARLREHRLDHLYKITVLKIRDFAYKNFHFRRFEKYFDFHFLEYLGTAEGVCYARPETFPRGRTLRKILYPASNQTILVCLVAILFGNLPCVYYIVSLLLFHPQSLIRS